MAAEVRDRFGIGWRPDLAAGILAHLDRIDIVEIIADDYFDAPAPKLSALRSLGAQVPLMLHGIGLGLASTVCCEPKRIGQMARLHEKIRPESWSEHFAFVRGGGVEIGHLAAPPRNRGTVQATAANLSRATETVGVKPIMENIATLIDPPGSDLTEAAWLSELLAASGGKLLLDLHNVHANSVNFGFDAIGFLDQLPLDRLGAIHLAGGKWIPAGDSERRLLDDHLHDVPDPVYELLQHVAARTANPLTVILERDGNYPAMVDLLAQLDRAREAVQQGRSTA
ncbi:MAG: DUF692 domain-containing protein [Bryobacteraceae bacterium]